ncbi:MAG: DMT family transporter [Candidatus Puniceispirillales bacterium]
MAIHISKQMIGISLIIISSMCFAVVPNSAKMALDHGVSLYFLILSRFIIGAAILLPYGKISGASFHIPREGIFALLVTGISALVLLATTYHAVEFIDIGLVLLILYSFPFGIAILARLRRGERLSLSRWLCMFVVLLGLGIMIYDGQGDINFYGIFISVIGLISFIIFIETSSQLAIKMGGAVLNFYISVIGLILMLTMLPLGFAFQSPQTHIGIMAIGANGVFFVLSWVLFFEGSRIIGITRASLLACIEPLFAALLALIFLGQQLTLIEWFGFFVVLTAIFLFEQIGLRQKTHVH